MTAPLKTIEGTSDVAATMAEIGRLAKAAARVLALASTEQNGTVAHAVVDLNRRYEWEWLGSMRGRFHRETRLDVPMPPR